MEHYRKGLTLVRQRNSRDRRVTFEGEEVNSHSVKGSETNVIAMKPMMQRPGVADCKNDFARDGWGQGAIFYSEKRSRRVVLY